MILRLNMKSQSCKELIMYKQVPYILMLCLLGSAPLSHCQFKTANLDAQRNKITISILRANITVHWLVKMESSVHMNK